jgi:uncharacterized protein HemX
VSEEKKEEQVVETTEAAAETQAPGQPPVDPNEREQRRGSRERGPRNEGEAAAGVVLLRPAAEGTGVIAGGPVRAVLECAGVHDVLSKSLGSSNTLNIVHATIEALRLLEEPEAVATRRGKTVAEVAPARLRGEKKETEKAGAK